MCRLFVWLLARSFMRWEHLLTCSCQTREVGAKRKNLTRMMKEIHSLEPSRHREFYFEGVANVLQGEWILSGRDGGNTSKFFHLYVYAVKCINVGSSKDPYLTQVSDFTVLFGSDLDAEVLSMLTDLFIARTMITKASLVFRGPIDVIECQVNS
ncbi:endoribonuclease Dicer homolog 1-like isoform X2 [Cornus florida]|uniref:endoribonuclease Dicer homolog 1-like isoform X2 n=1 Tax=Cornus florida TaxID=4283 RepID=UPI0028999A54|nr:endoribonuclease Dicer homolog 1-like isoform X2 [Cornus florida]